MLKRTQKKIRIAHAEPDDIRLGFILLPVGYSYNTQIAEAKKDDILRFVDGNDHKIFSVTRLKTGSAVAKQLCLIRYGITLEGALMRWRNNAKLEGHGTNVVSNDECLLVTYEIDPV